MQGTILRGIGGFYYAMDDDGTIHTLRAQGKIRRERLKPKVGDRVELTFAADSDSETAMGTIEEILSIAENAAYRAYIVPDETDGLRIGQSVTVRTE